MTDTVTGEGSAILQEKRALASKRDAIATACREQSLESLVKLANSEGGLLDDTFRTTAWPLLLGCTEEDEDASFANEKWKNAPNHLDEEQVQKDVDRAFVYYPINETQQSMQHKKKELFDLITKILRINPMLHYFQGYHDIAQVFLLVLGRDASFAAMSRVSLLRIRDYMQFSIGPSTKHLQLIPAILKGSDPDLATHLSKTPPYFGLSAVLTLYAHDIQAYTDIARLYDFILAHEPVMTVYLFAALIIGRRDEILEIPADEQDMLLFKLSKLPQPLDLQKLIDTCLKVFSLCPPEQLPGGAWRSISAYSVLKTSRNDLRTQSLQQGRDLFAKQAKELAKEELFDKIMKQMKKNRRPIISFGATLLVGVMSYYLRRNGHDRMLWTTLWRTTEFFRK